MIQADDPKPGCHRVEPEVRPILVQSRGSPVVVRCPMSPVTTDRRKALQIGSLATYSLCLPQLLAARESRPGAGKARHNAKACVFIFLQGGPAHQDTFDPKP